MPSLFLLLPSRRNITQSVLILRRWVTLALWRSPAPSYAHGEWQQMLGIYSLVTDETRLDWFASSFVKRWASVTNWDSATWRQQDKQGYFIGFLRAKVPCAAHSNVHKPIIGLISDRFLHNPAVCRPFAVQRPHEVSWSLQFLFHHGVTLKNGRIQELQASSPSYAIFRNDYFPRIFSTICCETACRWPLSLQKHNWWKPYCLWTWLNVLWRIFRTVPLQLDLTFRLRTGHSSRIAQSLGSEAITQLSITCCRIDALWQSFRLKCMDTSSREVKRCVAWFFTCWTPINFIYTWTLRSWQFLLTIDRFDYESGGVKTHWSFFFQNRVAIVLVGNTTQIIFWNGIEKAWIHLCVEKVQRWELPSSSKKHDTKERTHYHAAGSSSIGQSECPRFLMCFWRILVKCPSESSDQKA